MSGALRQVARGTSQAASLSIFRLSGAFRGRGAKRFGPEGECSCKASCRWKTARFVIQVLSRS